MPCPNCGADQPSPAACAACHEIFDDALGADHFAVLGLERRFDLDPASLQKRYLELARVLHPDGFAMAPSEKQALAMQLTAAVNDAARALRDPALRAEYLLGLAAPPEVARDRGTPPSFLAEMLELREELESRRASCPVPSPPADSAAWAENALQTARDAREEALNRFPALFERLLNDSDLDAGREIRRGLNMLTYHDNIIAEIDEWRSRK